MPITIDLDVCENTGVCAMVCPEDIIEIKNCHPVVINAVACTSCFKCAESCISSAIEVD